MQPWHLFFSRRHGRLLAKNSSAIIICPPLLRAEAQNKLCRVDQILVVVDPGENVPVRHSFALGIDRDMPPAAYRGFVHWRLANAGRQASANVASAVSGPASETRHRSGHVERASRTTSYSVLPSS